MENLVVHPKSITDLTVTLTLPEEFLDKEVRITAEPLEKEKSVKEQIAADPYLEDCIAHLEWRGIAKAVREDGHVTVVFEEQR